MIDPSVKPYFDLGSLVDTVAKYLKSFDKELFLKAYRFAESAHKGQFRKDKKTPYIVHPLNVVNILAGMHADQDILISALLHDVPEDTSHTVKEVKELFGSKVAFLVDGITKLSKVHYQNDMSERKVESLKKLFLHSAEDSRIILIKLADRLHNMRTLQNIEVPEKRLRISRETLEIFVPMANLLGLQALKSELEDLCFKYLFSDDYKKLSEVMAKKREDNKKHVSETIQKLEAQFKAGLMSVKISERHQNLYTIYKKLCSNGKTLNDVSDRIAIKIVTKNSPSCYEALGVVHQIFTPKTSAFKDYIASPKVNKYRSLHTMVFGVNGILTEFQIRTEEMNLEAEYGISANFFGTHKTEINKDERSLWVDKIAKIGKIKGDNDGFLTKLKEDVLKDRIFVFTPKGETIDLPKGASAIDFAYAVHTNIGKHACKAEINANLMPISAVLKTGDIVNIITKSSCSPSLSWFSFAKTNLARNKIHSYFHKTSGDKKKKEGQKILQKEFDIAGLGLVKKMSFKRISQVLDKIFGKSFSNLDDLFSAIGGGEVKAVGITKALRDLKKPKANSIKLYVKIVATDRFGLLGELSKIMYKHASDMTSLKVWTQNVSKNEKLAYFTFGVAVNDMEEIGLLFDEIEQVDDVRSVYRFSTKAYYVSIALVAYVFGSWIIHPFVLGFLYRLDFWKRYNISFNVFVYFSLFLLFALIVLITNLAGKHFPYIRHKRLLWISAFTLPLIALLTLLVELFYFDLKLSVFAVFIEFAILYFYLGMNYFSLRKQHS